MRKKNNCWFNVKKILPTIGQQCFVNVVDSRFKNEPITNDDTCFDYVPSRIMTGFLVNSFIDLEKIYPIKLWHLNIVYKDFTNKDEYFSEWQLLQNRLKEPFIVTHWKPMNLKSPMIYKDDL